jgi:predicted transcriptional regulator
MPKVSKRSHFIKSFEHLLTGKLTAREVLIYGIIDQFEANDTPCFISRHELAKRINESEATAERALQLLIQEGYIIARRAGRKRYLSTGYPQEPDLYQLDTNEVSDLYQNRGQSVSKQGVDLYQPDTLTRSITRSINKTNNETKDASDKYQMVWDDANQVMVRRKIQPHKV